MLGVRFGLVAAAGEIVPKTFFNVVSYAGTGSAGNVVTGVGFSPDLGWLQASATLYSLICTDTTFMGIGKIFLEATAGVASENGPSSFDANGFTLGAGTHKAYYNASSTTYYAMNFKKTSGAFDIVSYTGNGTNPRNISHNLGVVPEMIILLAPDTGNTYVYHKSAGNTKKIIWDSVGADSTDSNAWNNTTPTSSIFTVGSTFNANTGHYIALLFATSSGNSSVGSYTGNGSATGPTVSLDFQPQFVIINTPGYDWVGINSAQNPSNPRTAWSAANGDGGTLSGGVDFNASSFQIKDTAANVNTNGATYRYLAVGS